LAALLRREDGRRHELILDGRMVPRVAAIGERLRAPHIGLRPGAGRDLVVRREGRELDLEHTARGACALGNVFEGDG